MTSWHDLFDGSDADLLESEMTADLGTAADSAPISTGGLCHIYAPPATHRFVLAKTCPDCRKRTRMLGWAYEWLGASVTCLRCGRKWEDGEWMPLPFMRGARQHNIDEAKARWRMGMWHNAQVTGRPPAYGGDSDDDGERDGR